MVVDRDVFERAFSKIFPIGIIKNWAVHILANEHFYFLLVIFCFPVANQMSREWYGPIHSRPQSPKFLLAGGAFAR